MRRVLVLVALLHLCYSYKLNMTLSKEIIGGLTKLNHLYRTNKSNVTPPDRIRMPSKEMGENASSCVGVFIRELKQLLHNVTVHTDYENVVQEIKANLNTLRPLPESDQECQMIEMSDRLKPFQQHIKFLKELNRKG